MGKPGPSLQQRTTGEVKEAFKSDTNGFFKFVQCAFWLDGNFFDQSYKTEGHHVSHVAGWRAQGVWFLQAQQESDFLISLFHAQTFIAAETLAPPQWEVRTMERDMLGLGKYFHQDVKKLIPPHAGILSCGAYQHANLHKSHWRIKWGLKTQKMAENVISLKPLRDLRHADQHCLLNTSGKHIV